MLTRSQILKMLVGLKEVNDLDLLKGDAVLSTSCLEVDKPTVRAMGAIINEVYDDFDYTTSPEFLQKIEGKSAEFKSMYEKVFDREKLNEVKQRLGDAISTILESDDAYALIAPTYHDRLRELKNLTESLSEPA